MFSIRKFYVLHFILDFAKPSKTINSVELLLVTISQMFKLHYQELCNAWKTFPESVQLSLWKNTRCKIQTYGKFL